MFVFWKHCGKLPRLRQASTRRPHSFRPQVEELESRQLLSSYFVATTGNDANPGTLAKPFKTIQHGLDVASKPGDTVEVRGGTYHERLTFTHSGSAAGGYVTLENYPGEHVLLSGKGANDDDVGYGENMVQILNKSYVRLLGFEVAYDNGIAAQDEAHGVLVLGSGSNVQIRSNAIHDITGSVSLGVGGSGIQVYGTSRSTPYANVILDGNTIYNCQPGDSETETLTVNGNVSNFQITNNLIHNNNNIGMDMIGGEADVFGLPPGTLGLPVARNGLCSHNTVYNIHANYGGGFAGGIYVDGGKDITVTDNISYENDMGLEIGSENHGYVASGITVSDNLLYNNYQGGLVFGGYDSTRGRVENCRFINNTVYNSDRSNTGQGALMINYASNNLVANNIFVASANNVLINSPYPKSNVSNTLDYNLYYAPGGVTRGQFTWNGQPDGSFYTFGQYQHATREDAHSLFGNPFFVNVAATNFHLTSGSPAINGGSSKHAWYAPVDFAGTTRDLPPEIGAYEYEAKSSDGSHLVYQSQGANSAQNPAFGSSPQSWQPLDDFLMAEELLATDALSWCWHTLDAFLVAEWSLPTDALFLFTGLENVWSL